VLNAVQEELKAITSTTLPHNTYKYEGGEGVIEWQLFHMRTALLDRRLLLVVCGGCHWTTAATSQSAEIGAPGVLTAFQLSRANLVDIRVLNLPELDQ